MKIDTLINLIFGVIFFLLCLCSLICGVVCHAYHQFFLATMTAILSYALYKDDYLGESVQQYFKKRKADKIKTSSNDNPGALRTKELM